MSRILSCTVTAVALFVAQAPAAFAQSGAPPGAASLVGTYKLVAFTYSVDGGPSIPRYEKTPTGYIIVTPGRLMSMTVAGGRKFGPSPAEKAALLDSLLAYTGTYRIEGDKLITAVDASWIQYWDGTEVVRYFKLDGNRLSIRTPPAPMSTDPTKTATAELLWERVE